MNVFGARIILPNGNGVLTALTAKKKRRAQGCSHAAAGIKLSSLKLSQ